MCDLLPKNLDTKLKQETINIYIYINIKGCIKSSDR